MQMKRTKSSPCSSPARSSLSRILDGDRMMEIMNAILTKQTELLTKYNLLEEKLDTQTKTIDAKFDALTSELDTKLAEKTKALDDSLAKQVKELKDELSDEMGHVRTSMEHLFKVTSDFEKSYETYRTSNNKELATLNTLIMEQAKTIETLKLAVKSMDAKDRKLNLVVYGIPEPTARGQSPIQWNEETRHQIINTTGIDLPKETIRGFLRMGNVRSPAANRRMPAPIKIYFTSEMGKATFYHSYLSKRDALANSGVRVRNDYDLETRKFRSATDPIRTNLFKLGYKVRFIKNGDTLQVISPDGRKRGEYRSIDELMEFVKLEKLNLDKVTVN